MNINGNEFHSINQVIRLYEKSISFVRFRDMNYILITNIESVMKKIFITLILLSILLPAGAQHEIDLAEHTNHGKRPACDSRAQLADSSVSYAFNSETGSYYPESVIQYFYNDNLDLEVVISKTLPERSNIYKQIFQYNHNDLMIRYIYQIWVDNEWRDNLITEKTYTPDGLLDTEVFIRENAEGIFMPYQRHFYTQEGDRLISYLRQVKNAAGEWYDFSNHYYVYDDDGRLTVLYGTYFNSDLVYWERTSVYSEDGNIAERYLKQLKYDPDIRMNVLTNNTLQKYHYNIYRSADTIYNYTWNNQKWVYQGKNIGYFSLIKGKKVSVCHNGITLCISSHAVKAHLEHGDKLGACTPEACNEGRRNPYTGSDKKTSEAFFIYPNPVGKQITIKIQEDTHLYFRAFIVSADGDILGSYDAEGKSEINADLSNLQNGIYYVKMQKKKGFDTRAFIKN